MGYAYQATLTIPAAVGSSIATPISIVIKGTDIKLATVANGGQVQHTVTRNSQTMPADVIFSSNSLGTSLYNWGWDFYNPVTGDYVIWILLATWSNSAPFNIFVFLGNSAISTYQGGAVGAEFPASRHLVLHLTNNSGTLNAVDFSANGNNGSTTTVTATTGQIDGAGSFPNSSKLTTGPNNPGSGSNVNLDIQPPLTYECWINPANVTGNKDIYNAGASGLPQFRLQGANPSLDNANVGNIGTSTGAVSASIWTHIAVTYDASGNWAFYINGVVAHTGTTAVPTNWLSTNSRFISHQWGLGFLNSQPLETIDEFCVSNVVRSANELLNSYTNQSSPPSIGTFVSTTTGIGNPITTLGCM